MAYEVNGIKYSYEYNDLIEELQAGLDEGLIELSTIILILRAKDARVPEIDYRPIIDYYYPDDYKNNNMEALYNREEYTDNEWEKLKADYKDGYEQYLRDEPYLEKASVLAILTEMKLWNDIA